MSGADVRHRLGPGPTCAPATAALRLTALTLTIAAVWVLATAASIAFATPSWFSPTNLSAAGRDAVFPKIALNANGDAVVVWDGNNGATNWWNWKWRVQAATRPAGGRWSGSRNLSYEWPGAGYSQVALDAYGGAVAVWSRSDHNNDWIVQAASRPAGGEWSDPRDLSLAWQNVIGPQVAIDAYGGTVAVWNRYDGTNWIVQAASRPAGAPRWRWSEPRDLSLTGHWAFRPQVAIDASGGAVAVWDRSDGTNWRVQAASRPAGGEWSVPRYLSTAGRSAERPQVALNTDGDAVAVWKSFDGGNWRVQAASRTAGGEWSVPRSLSADMRDAFAPQVALNAGGDAVAVWYRRSGNDYTGYYFVVQAASRPAGGEWSVPRDLSHNPSYPGRDDTVPQIALNANGDAAVVWLRNNGANSIVQATTRHTWGFWSEPRDLSLAGHDASAPQVAIDASGGSVAVWYRSDGTNWRVQQATHAHLISGKVGMTRHFPTVRD